MSVILKAIPQNQEPNNASATVGTKHTSYSLFVIRSKKVLNIVIAYFLRSGERLIFLLCFQGYGIYR